MSAPKKVLFTAHVDSHILAFHTPYLKYFKDKGYEVHVASHGDAVVPHTDVKYDVPIERSPLKLNNLRAIRQLKEIIDRENYDIIHTHTPMGSVVTRLAAMAARKKGTRVIYTAHGFHFFKGAPLLNWLIYYPIEKLLAHQTDDLITINNEDYERAKAKFKTKVHYVPGVGIDPKKFDIKMTKVEKSKLRKSLGLKDNDFVMIYVAELSKRKNQMWLVKTLEEMMKNDKKVHLLLPGKDSINGKLHKLVKSLDLGNQVHLLGFRSDIPQLMKISDMAVSAAKQEGLPVNLMEAMYLGLPIVATDCRGNRDLVIDGETGFIVPTGDSVLFAKKAEDLHASTKLCTILGKQGKKEVRKYIFEDILGSIESIYHLPDKQSTEPIRVLQIVTSMNRAGLETMLMNYYRHIDRSKVQFDFLVHRSKKGDYDDEIIKLGGKIYRFPPITIGSMLTYSARIKAFLADHTEYAIVHSHLDALSTLPLAGAKRAGVPVRIAHSHNNGFSIDIKYALRVILKKLIPRYATNLFACSKSAGDFMFGSNVRYEIIKNAIDTKQFGYKPEVRTKVRKQLGVEGNLVFGHVGRFSYQKNHDLLIDIFSAVSKQREDVVLLLIGTGELEDAIKSKVDQLGLGARVKFLGVRSDIADLMNAMDVFVMPSRHEGLPVVSVEAQASGLRCVFSNAVTKELDATNLCSFVGLTDLESWTSELTKKVTLDRGGAADLVTLSGYDIADAAYALERAYINGDWLDA